MPTYKSRHDQVKMYRPNGMRYTSARDVNLTVAMNLAKKKFLEEFGYEPQQMHETYEVIGLTGAWDVTFMEIKG